MIRQSIAIFGVKYFPSKGGTSRVVENLLEELKEHFDITIYCYKHPEAENHIPGIRTVQFSEIPIKGIGVFLYLFRCCLHLLIRGKFDLVHVHKTDSAFFLPLLRLKFRLVATSHAMPYLNEKWSRPAKWYFKLAERLYMQPDTMRTAVSRSQKNYYTGKYLQPVRYIPNGIHPVKTVSRERAAEILDPLQIQDGYLFFAARRVIPLKGCHHLIEALRLLQFKGTLVIAGDIEQMPAYTRRLQEARREMDVHFIGYVSDRELLNSLISRSGLFVFPSEIEGMSMMLLEVGSVGTPMICSNIPQNTDVLSKAEVLFFQSENPSELAAKLKWALAHPAEMKLLAKNAKAKIEQEYSVKKVAQKYINLYQEMISPLYGYPRKDPPRQKRIKTTKSNL